MATFAAPTRTKVDALVLKGGGVKALAFAGAIIELERFYEFSAFVGTSAGAIAAVLLAAGYSGSQLESELRRFDFRSVRDSGRIIATKNLITRSWMYQGYPLRQWVRDLLQAKAARSVPATMRDLPQRAVVYATTPTRATVTFDSHGQNATTDVDFAVRCSASIPYFFEPQFINGQHVYDGGLLNNFPVGIFLKQEQDAQRPTPTFLALYLGTVSQGRVKPRRPLFEMLSILLDRDERLVLDQALDQTVVVDPAPIRTTDFGLTEDEKDLLVVRGRVAALQYLLTNGNGAATTAAALGQLQERAEQLRDKTLRRRRMTRLKLLAIPVLLAMGAAAATVFIAPSRGFEVRGFVKNEVGRPVPGARVSIDGDVDNEVVTELDGSFSPVKLADVERGATIVIRVTRSSYRSISTNHLVKKARLDTTFILPPVR